MILLTSPRHQARNELFYKDDQQVLVKIKSGHPFTMTTRDPERYPLQSYGLLEMQWQNSVNVSGLWNIGSCRLRLVAEMTSCFRPRIYASTMCYVGLHLQKLQRAQAHTRRSQGLLKKAIVSDCVKPSCQPIWTKAISEGISMKKRIRLLW